MSGRAGADRDSGALKDERAAPIPVRPPPGVADDRQAAVGAGAERRVSARAQTADATPARSADTGPTTPAQPADAAAPTPAQPANTAAPTPAQPANTAPTTPARSANSAPSSPARPGDTKPSSPARSGGEHGGPASRQRDPAAVRGFIERFTALLTFSGFPRTPARIFVAMLTSDSSWLTAAELADLLQASPASVSGGVRYLLHVGLITAEGEPGSRRLHYRMSQDIWQDIVQLRATQFTRWAAELREGVEVLGADSAAGARMAHTVSYFEFISSEIAGLLARWRERADSGAP